MTIRIYKYSHEEVAKKLGVRLEMYYHMPHVFRYIVKTQFVHSNY